ncbi:PREDICTED: probable cytochrome P450 49a1 [Nicrophorus vespilloides]|uniref:Probable cytochrome P450 49a1 n=1 Tax=Nicrophorus vespilloides TaxID=110193 RepID=A0ABM1NJW5_NICVS|nr:PREDICTED: probable cytochrome P450 49a1 [Nicrophorus vespilloides]
MRSSQKLLKPLIGNVIKKATYSTKTDRPYSTAIGVMPDEYETIPQHYEPSVSDIKPYSEVPGPREFPLIGNSWRFAPLIGQYKIHELDKVMWSLYKDFGKIVKVGGLIGHPDLLFVFSGNDIQKVFRKEEVLPHRPSMPSLHYYKQHLKKEFFEGNEGVIGVHGPKWDDFRKQVQQILLPPATAKKYIDPLNVIASDFLDRMDDMRDSNDELPSNFLSEIYKWALESVARVALDIRLGCLNPDLAEDSESQRIIDAINTFFWNVAEVELKMPVWRVYKNKSFRKYIGALEDFRTVCMKYIEQTMDKMQVKNYDNIKEEDISIVERILQKTQNPKLAAVLALDLLLVGVDTTSIALASTIYQLTQNQANQDKLYAELKAVMPNKDSKVDATVQENIPYLRACIKETLRMYPVIIGNGRSLQSDTVISGYKIPKGTHVIFPHLVVSNIDTYFDQPETFRPERWIKKCPVKHHPFVSLPFGYGRRSCLGRRFAEAELHIMLAKIFRKYKVEYNYGELTYKITPTYVPEQPLKFKLTERKD